MGRTYFNFTFDNSELISLLDRLEKETPTKVEKALDTMGNKLKGNLVKNAPYDTKHHKAGTKHLKEVITRTKVRKSGGASYTTIFVSPRGENDKNVYKLVVAEYGRSNLAPKPFWKPTVTNSENELIEIASQIILEE